MHRDSGRDYIGISVNIKRRWKEHVREGLRNSRALPKFYPVLHKYGADAFDWSVLAKASCFNGACQLEKLARALGYGFLNCTIGGEGTCGVERSEETRAKLSAVHKGKPKSEMAKANMRASAKLRVVGPEEMARRNAAVIAVMTGRVVSPETRAKLSASKLGVSMPAHVREALIKANTGKHHTPEHKAKISEAGKNRKHSAETRAKIGASNRTFALARKINP